MERVAVQYWAAISLSYYITTHTNIIMRKLLLLASICFALNLSAQKNWNQYDRNRSIMDEYSWMEEMRYDDEFSYSMDYQPDMSVRESRKTRKKLRRAKRGQKHLVKTNFSIVPDRENLTVTAHIDAETETSYHLKLTTKKGKKVVKSFLHLSPQTVQEIQLMQLLPGKYQLSLYAGVERKLISRYDVNRY